MSPKDSAPPHKEPNAKTRSRLSVGAVRSEETTNAILNAAAQILEERGYAGFSLDAVVALAESSKPTIYRWWKNKAALIRDVYERSGESFIENPDTGCVKKDLNLYLTSLWRWWNNSRSGEVFVGFLTELQQRPELMEEFRASFLPRRQQALRIILQRAADRGDIRGGYLLESAVTLLTSLGWLHLLSNQLSSETAIHSAVNLVMQGLRPEITDT